MTILLDIEWIRELNQYSVMYDGEEYLFYTAEEVKEFRDWVFVGQGAKLLGSRIAKFDMGEGQE